jgi:hypothetical protein
MMPSRSTDGESTSCVNANGQVSQRLEISNDFWPATERCTMWLEASNASTDCSPVAVKDLVASIRRTC